MANEINVTGGLTIRRINDLTGRPLIDERFSATWLEDMAGMRGPTPGSFEALLASEGGHRVDLSHLTRPTWCWVGCHGPSDGSAVTGADHVTFGVWNAQDTSFAPLLEFPPGLFLPLRLSRNIQEIYQGPGTGTAAGGQTARLMAIAYPRRLIAVVKAFEF